MWVRSTFYWGCSRSPAPSFRRCCPAGVNYESVLERVRALLGEGNMQSGGMLELTPRSKKILESSILESRKLHHSFVGTEHFWLALLKEGEGVAVSLLRSMGVDTQEMQQKILEALAKSQPDGGEEGRLRPRRGAWQRRGQRAGKIQPRSGPRQRRTANWTR